MILTSKLDNTARLSEAATGQLIGQPMLHTAVVSSVAFGPDGKTVLTCSSGDKTARLWDAACLVLLDRPAFATS